MKIIIDKKTNSVVGLADCSTIETNDLVLVVEHPGMPGDYEPWHCLWDGTNITIDKTLKYTPPTNIVNLAASELAN